MPEFLQESEPKKSGLAVQTGQMASLFDSIAADYDRLNHLLSLGIDRTWRRRALRQVVDSRRPQQLLDLACGTGDFSIAIARRAHPGTLVTGVDISEGMLLQMEQKVKQAGMQHKIRMEMGNGEQLRFAGASMDAVSIAFGIRNFGNREAALKEIRRVLKPGGKLVILELSMPENALLRTCYRLYFTRVLPRIGGAVSGNASAYRYLPASVEAFPDRKTWMQTMSDCGYAEVIHKSFSLGICRMYVGTVKNTGNGKPVHES